MGFIVFENSQEEKDKLVLEQIDAYERDIFYHNLNLVKYEKILEDKEFI